jgi:hypothetical protein
MAIIIVMLGLMFLLRPKNKTAAEKERSEKRFLMMCFIAFLITGIGSLIIGGGIMIGLGEVNRSCNFNTGRGQGLCFMMLDLSLWLSATFGETTARLIIGPIWILFGLFPLYWAYHFGVYLFHQRKSGHPDR